MILKYPHTYFPSIQKFLYLSTIASPKKDCQIGLLSVLLSPIRFPIFDYCFLIPDCSAKIVAYQGIFLKPIHKESKPLVEVRGRRHLVIHHELIVKCLFLNCTKSTWPYTSLLAMEFS